MNHLENLQKGRYFAKNAQRGENSPQAKCPEFPK